MSILDRKNKAFLETMDQILSTRPGIRRNGDVLQFNGRKLKVKYYPSSNSKMKFGIKRINGDFVLKIPSNYCMSYSEIKNKIDGALRIK